ncbi:MAG TPA: alpha/beta family hydrolase [Candidatus Dormibacteraeota bacterium]|jgi:predicted alpha/beta-hydrolase family hydrolase|nr:alpha/beta family hydrolase [Candidatus Dormibacteraeota bacterium]
MPAPSGPLVILGHGASGTAASMRPHVTGLEKRGVAARAIDLPKGRAERAMPVFAAAVDEAGGGDRTVIGGHSFGGRVASMLAAEREVLGLVLLSYPLHRPGHPEDLRVEHWPRIACPVLLLSGESDPFARAELLRENLPLLRDATLHTYPGVQHGLGPVLDDALDRVAEFVRSLARSPG